MVKDLLWWGFLTLGGISLLFNTLNSGIPRVVAFVLPLVIKAVHRFTMFLLGHEAVKAAAVKYKDRIMPLLKAIVKAVEQIIEAAEKEVEDDIQAAAPQAPAEAVPPAEPSAE